MAKNRISVPIQREIDKQKIIQFLCSGDEYGLYFSVRFRNERDFEEEERKWKEDIQKLKEILAEYQKMTGGASTQSLKI